MDFRGWRRSGPRLCRTPEKVGRMLQAGRFVIFIVRINESEPGKKDHKKLRAFIAAAKDAAQ